MKILFLHGWHSVVGGVKPTYLKDAGHEVLNPALDDDDFEAALQTAQQVFDQHRPDVVVGSSRGGAIAMNLDSSSTPLVLLCPAWKNWGSGQTLKSQAAILHSRADDVIPFSDSEELIAASGLPAATLIETGSDHRLADPQSLETMLQMCEKLTSKEHDCEGSVSLEMLIDLFGRVDRKGPGSSDSTIRALSLVRGLAAQPKVVDLGCGSGIATLVLAKQLKTQVVAIDLVQPFLDRLVRCAEEECLSDRVLAIQGDMSNPPIEPDSVDLIWSEAAIYNVGFRRGLEMWKRLLRPGGCVAVSEVVWLTDSPSPKAREFWEAEYPAITTIEANLQAMQDAGYEPLGHFTLPPSDWEQYYEPLEACLEEFVLRSTKEASRSLALSVKREIALWREHETDFGYCFFVGRQRSC